MSGNQYFNILLAACLSVCLSCRSTKPQVASSEPEMVIMPPEIAEEATLEQVDSSAVELSLTDTLWLLLKEKKYDEAELKIASVLQQDSINVDAIMMKGNLVLARYLDSADSASFFYPFNESIFDSVPHPVEIRLITPGIAHVIDSLWKRSLSIDSNRIDIHQGLCYVYSLALMQKELIAELEILKRIIGDNMPGLMYSMGEYAQMFEERGHFEQAMEIYHSIESWYPNVAGLLSDIGLMYFQHADFIKAKLYFNRAMEGRDPDDLVYSNSRLFYTAEGSYDRGLQAASALSGIDKSNDGLLYRGIYEYYMGDVNWKASLATYLRLNENERDRSTFRLAKALLAPSNIGDYKSYLRIDSLEKPDIYAIMLHKRAAFLFKTEILPIVKFGQLGSYYYSSAEAVKAFMLAGSGKVPMTSAQEEGYIFYYAWALQLGGRKIEAAMQWKKLLYIENFYRKSAAAYFYGKYLQGIGYEKDAAATFTLVSRYPERSKYAAYCALLLQKVGK